MSQVGAELAKPNTLSSHVLGFVQHQPAARLFCIVFRLE